MGRAEKIILFNSGASFRKALQECLDTPLFCEAAKSGVVCINAGRKNYLEENDFFLSSIVRVLRAKEDWSIILQYAGSKDLSIVLLNLLEEELVFAGENIRKGVPSTVLGQLVAFLYARFIAFSGSPLSGLTILLIHLSLEGKERLKALILEMAHLNGLEYAFIDWLETANDFFGNKITSNT